MKFVLGMLTAILAIAIAVGLDPLQRAVYVMSIDTTKRKTIANAKLHRIESDLSRLRRHPIDGPMLREFGCDHSNGVICDTNGKWDLLFENNGDHVRADAARLIQHCSVENITELVRGYRLARDAGLLGD